MYEIIWIMLGRMLKGGLKKWNIPLILPGWAFLAATALKSWECLLSTIKSLSLTLSHILTEGVSMAEQQEPRCKLMVLLEFTAAAKPRSWGFEMLTSCHVLLFRELRAVNDGNKIHTVWSEENWRAFATRWNIRYKEKVSNRRHSSCLYLCTTLKGSVSRLHICYNICLKHLAAIKWSPKETEGDSEPKHVYKKFLIQKWSPTVRSLDWVKAGCNHS